MAKQGGENDPYPENRNPESHERDSLEDIPLPPPSRRNRPVKKVRKEVVFEEPETSEKEVSSLPDPDAVNPEEPVEIQEKQELDDPLEEKVISRDEPFTETEAESEENPDHQDEIPEEHSEEIPEEHSPVGITDEVETDSPDIRILNKESEQVWVEEELGSENSMEGDEETQIEEEAEVIQVKEIHPKKKIALISLKGKAEKKETEEEENQDSPGEELAGKDEGAIQIREIQEKAETPAILINPPGNTEEEDAEIEPQKESSPENPSDIESKDKSVQIRQIHQKKNTPKITIKPQESEEDPPIENSLEEEPLPEEKEPQEFRPRGRKDRVKRVKKEVIIEDEEPEVQQEDFVEEAPLTLEPEPPEADENREIADSEETQSEIESESGVLEESNPEETGEEKEKKSGERRIVIEELDEEDDDAFIFLTDIGTPLPPKTKIPRKDLEPEKLGFEFTREVEVHSLESEPKDQAPDDDSDHDAYGAEDSEFDPDLPVHENPEFEIAETEDPEEDPENEEEDESAELLTPDEDQKNSGGAGEEADEMHSLDSRDTPVQEPEETAISDSPAPRIKIRMKSPSDAESEDISASKHSEPVSESAPNAENKAGRRRRPLRVIGVILFFIAAGALTIWFTQPDWIFGEKKAAKKNCLGISPQISPGINLQKMECAPGVVGFDESLEKILLSRKVDWQQSLELIQEAGFKKVPGLEPGMEYKFLYPKGNANRPELFAYEPEPGLVVLLTLKGEPEAIVHRRKVIETRYKSLSALIRNSFAETMFNRESGLDLTQLVYEAMKWKIDLFDLEPGDRFDLVYQEQELEGGKTVLKDLVAVHFFKDDKDFYSFKFETDIVSGYFDEEGRPVKTPFLMMPLRYGRISSPYNWRRRDPLNPDEIRPHLGTDYAAPEGTEIIAVADGIVEEASYTRNNGFFVKIAHQNQIKTQYLHMRNFAEGIEPGEFVEQGEVIGFVGTTGRTTGPHVCFRYWKNGVQVDHRKEQFTPSQPMAGNISDRFFARRDSLMDFWVEN